MKLGTLILRQWQCQPGRALSTALSVAVAVGAVVATWAAADASRMGYRRLVEAVEGQPSLMVVARDGGRFESTALPRLGGIQGIRAVVPLFFRPTLLRGGSRRIREVAVGVDLPGLIDAGLLTLAAGEPCAAAGETVLETQVAETLGLGLGDEVLFFARRGVVRLRITGLVEGESLRWFAEGAGVVVDIDALGRMSLSDGMLDRVRIAVATGADRERVRSEVAARLPDGLEVVTPVGMQQLADDVLYSAHLGLDFVTGLTVAMAWFIVGNAMLMNVTERRRGLALIRLLGATATQIRWLIIVEAAGLGLIGAVVGAGVGMIAARPLSAGIIRSLQAPEAEMPLNPSIAAISVVVAVLITVGAAWWPSREALRTDILDGISASPPIPETGISRTHVAAVILFGTLSEGILGLVAIGWLPPRASVPAGISLLLAFVAATPLVLPFLVRLLARVVPRRLRIERSLAVEQILRHPVRTALTTGVMVVAVTNGIGLGHSIRDSVDDLQGWYARTLRADWVLTRAGLLTPVAPDHDPDRIGTEEAIRDLEGVAAVEGVSVAIGRIGGSAAVVVARDPPAGTLVVAEPVNASAAEVGAALERGEALAGTLLARRMRIEPGDEIAVEVGGRTVRVQVAMLIVDYTAGGGSLMVNRVTGRRLFGLDEPDIVLVTAESGEAATLREPLARIAADHAMIVRSFRDLQLFVETLVQGVVGSLWSILGLGFFVGSLGVANTVTMNVLEQQRTLCLLRAVGMQPGQVARLVWLQSVLLGAAGGLIGVTSGLVTAAFIQMASQPLLGHPVGVNLRPGVVVTNVAAAIVVAAVASGLPIRRVMGMDLLKSIASD